MIPGSEFLVYLADLSFEVYFQERKDLFLKKKKISLF